MIQQLAYRHIEHATGPFCRTFSKLTGLSEETLDDFIFQDLIHGQGGNGSALWIPNRGTKVKIRAVHRDSTTNTTLNEKFTLTVDYTGRLSNSVGIIRLIGRIKLVFDSAGKSSVTADWRWKDEVL